MVACATGGIQLGSLVAPAIEQVTDHGVEVAGGLEPDDRRVEQLDRRHLTTGHECALPDRVDPGQFESSCGVHQFGIFAPRPPPGNRGTR